ncbi:tetratricopeptide repeat protein [Hirschia litorea]|uniref:Tetratricopeptide repeat protein n=1 Tax=Hirschia litorea TaxID=1199156 RepID=A0ABW2INL5_9PROT
MTDAKNIDVANTTAEKTDVFISYSSKDRDKAALVAEALGKSGLNVWWDRSLLPGDSYEVTIEKALKDAKAVVVCWTENAVASDWVRSEADDARVHGKLCPVMLQVCNIPKPFDRIHTEDLSGWHGNRDHHAFQELEEAVKARVEGRAAKAIPWKRKWITRGALVSFLAMAGVAAANVSLVKDLLVDDDARIEKLVSEQIAAALAASGKDMDARSTETLKDAVNAVFRSSDIEKAAAREALAAGNVEGAALSLAEVAARQALAAGNAVTAAAQSYSEAGALFAASDTSKAVDAYQKSLELVPNNPDAANGLAPLYERLGRMEEAEALYTSILNGVGTSDEKWRAKALGNLALMAEGRGEYETALAGLTEAKAIFEKLRDQGAVARALVNLGNLTHAMGDYEKSIDYSERALALSKQLGLPQGEAAALGNIGYAKMSLNDYESARTHFAQSLEAMDRAGMETEKGNAYLNLTLMLSNEGKLNEAEAMARKALDLGTRMQSRLIEGGALNHLAIIARDRQEYDQALAFHAEAIAALEQIKARNLIVREYRSQANTAIAMGDGEKAIELYKSALAVAEEMQDVTTQVRELSSVAEAEFNINGVDAALPYIEDAQQRCVAAGDDACLAKILRIHGEYQTYAGDMPKAVSLIGQSVELYESIGEVDAQLDGLRRIARIAQSVSSADLILQATDESLALARSRQPVDHEGISSDLEMRIEALFRQDRIDEAIVAARENIDIATAYQGEYRPIMLANAHVMMANLIKTKNQNEDADTHFQNAIALLEESGKHPEQLASIRQMAGQ